MNKKIKYVLITSSLLVIILLIILIINMPKTLDEQTIIKVDGELKENYSVTIESLYPGKEILYTIELVGTTPKYTYLDFYNESNGILKDYIDVIIKTDEIEINKQLNELLEGDSYFVGNNINKIEITYKMKLESGNDTQKQDIHFNLRITGTNRENG